MKFSAKPGWLSWIVALLSAALLLILIMNHRATEAIFGGDLRKYETRFIPPEEGTWRFIVSGDSRNCGDVVMPAIAADSALRYQPSFYWHLGDLRAIYMIDEDMAYAEIRQGRYLGCQNYLKRAWPDFIENQIGPFGSTPFYLGIGNHENIPPVSKSKFTEQFADWLMAPSIKAQRIADKDCDEQLPPAPAAKNAGSRQIDCLIRPRNYYHWIQGGVDFLYLDNASNEFGTGQVNWFKKTLTNAAKNDEVRSLVVGMHEALPDSISSDHAMCDDAKRPNPKYPYATSCAEGRDVYQRLFAFSKDKPVYVLASHSHFYMDGIFNTTPVANRLPGWIVGTAGAVRYELPPKHSGAADARANVYGYLLATVKADGKIDFKFKEIKDSDVPKQVQQRYPAGFVSWCFAHNSEAIDPNLETTNRCTQ